MKLKLFITCFLISFFVTIGNSVLSVPELRKEYETIKKESQTKFQKGENFGKDWLLQKNMPVFSDPKIESFRANIYQKETKIRIAFFLSPDSKNIKMDCKLSFNPMYLFVIGKPILFDTQTLQKKGIDYNFKNERLIFDVTATDHLKYIEINVSCHQKPSPR